ncbi:hypothetical protein [Methylobacterium sp. E-066]|uniref:hypothetical protein n=1 Tax=Methylobacterium sp. E-066 TaxID=2836584 RepID=UPI001FB9D7EC|nr:hypothetical protein [Methylobacterium sp. E-066]
MAFRLTDVLRWFSGGDAKEKPLFKNEKEAYDFCRNAYAKNGGVPAELRRSYEFYQKNFDDECDPELRLERH